MEFTSSLLSPTEPRIAYGLCIHRAGISGPLHGHPSLNTFGLIGRRVLKILSSRIQLKENLRMSLLFAFHLMFTSINLTADMYGASTVRQVLGWQYQNRKREITALELLTI